LRVHENTVFGYYGQKISGGCRKVYTMTSFIIRTPPNIMMAIKLRIRWEGCYATRTEDMKISYKILVGKPESHETTWVT
jgi:hypothetical protein